MKNSMLPLFLVAFLALNMMLPVVHAQFLLPNQSNLLSIILGKSADQIPSDWLNGPNYVLNLIFYIILPFLAIVAAVYGIMYDLRLFRHGGVRMALSLAMAGMTLPTGWLLTAVFWLYSIDATIAALAFGVVFFVGILFWAAGKFMLFGAGIKSEAQLGKESARYLGTVDRELGMIRTRISELKEKEMRQGLSDAERRELTEAQQKEIRLVSQRRGVLEVS